MIERTFSIIKPGAVSRNVTGKINAMIEEAGFVIIAQKMLHISKEKAAGFYIIHKDRPFYNDLVNYMSSSPIVVQVLKKEDAVVDYRTLMGATNPINADAGTIRAVYGVSIDDNAVHGSDSLENANIEIKYFFDSSEVFDR